MILHICYLTTREIAAVVPEAPCSVRLSISDTSLRNAMSIFSLEVPLIIYLTNAYQHSSATSKV